MTQDVASSTSDHPAASNEEEVRKKLQNEFDKKQHSWDLAYYREMMNDDNLLRRYMKRKGNRIEQSASFISSVLEWRKKESISQLTDQSFPTEFWRANGIFIHGEDINGHIVLWLRISHTFNPPSLTPLLEKFILHQLIKVDQLASAKGADYGWIEVFDCTNAGLRNADAGLLAFISNTLRDYFPAGQKYILVHNLNWFLRAIKSLCFTWFTPAVKKRIFFTSGNQIHQYIPKNQLPDYLGGPPEAIAYKQVPKDCPTLDEMRKKSLIELNDDVYQTSMNLLAKCV